MLNKQLSTIKLEYVIKFKLNYFVWAFQSEVAVSEVIMKKNHNFVSEATAIGAQGLLPVWR